MPIYMPNARKVKLPDFMSPDPTTWVNLYASHGITDPNDKYNECSSESNADTVGPLPISGGEGVKYTLSMIDWDTRWFGLAPLVDITTKSTLWNNLGKLAWFKPSSTTAFQSTGSAMIKHIRGSIETSSRARSGKDWHEKPLSIFLGLRFTSWDDPNASAAGKLFGLPLCLPGLFLDVPEAEDQTLAHWFKEMMGSEVPLRNLVSHNVLAYLQVDWHKPPWHDSTKDRSRCSNRRGTPPRSIWDPGWRL